MAKKIKHVDINPFLEAVKGVKRLTSDKVQLNAKSNRQKMPRTSVSEEVIYFDEMSPTPPVQGEEYIAYKHSSISNKTLRKLRKGQYNVEAILDLHGMTVEKAKIAVEHFISESLQASLRVVLIIHGKGHHSTKPILKNKINTWLRQLDVVLAFCSAAQTHGSRGATYVLLKRS